MDKLKENKAYIIAGVIVLLIGAYLLLYSRSNPFALEEVQLHHYQVLAFEQAMGNRQTPRPGESAQAIWNRYNQVYEHFQASFPLVKRWLDTKPIWKRNYQVMKAFEGKEISSEIFKGNWRELTKEKTLSFKHSWQGGVWALNENVLFFLNKISGLNKKKEIKTSLALMGYNKNTKRILGGHDVKNNEKVFVVSQSILLDKDTLFSVYMMNSDERRSHLKLVIEDWQEGLIQHHFDYFYEIKENKIRNPRFSKTRFEPFHI
jgi:hypothetical protein